MEPILLDVPTELHTDRLHLRASRPGDGTPMYPVVRASLPELKRWLPWATDAYSAEDAELWCRRGVAKWAAREQFHFLIFLPAGGEYVGNVSLFNLNWAVPRAEIGYWLATPHCGKGIMSEAVGALSRMAFDTLKCERVEIRCDDQNLRSAAVAVRSGFTLDGVLRRESRGVDGVLRDMRVYAKLRGANA